MIRAIIVRPKPVARESSWLSVIMALIQLDDDFFVVVSILFKARSESKRELEGCEIDDLLAIVNYKMAHI
jgi:hypothetical protein